MIKFQEIIRNNLAQHLLEYAIVISLVAAAAVAMYVYVQRSVQGGIKMVEDEAFKSPLTGKEYKGDHSDIINPIFPPGGGTTPPVTRQCNTACYDSPVWVMDCGAGFTAYIAQGATWNCIPNRGGAGVGWNLNISPYLSCNGQPYNYGIVYHQPLAVGERPQCTVKYCTTGSLRGGVCIQ